jgi:hypothetical protein
MLKLSSTADAHIYAEMNDIPKKSLEFTVVNLFLGGIHSITIMGFVSCPSSFHSYGCPAVLLQITQETGG